MRRTFGFALVVAINMAANLGARADWQYTQWGMTPEQVMAASAGQLKICDEACKGLDTDLQIARFRGPYQSGPFKFTAYMLFDRRNNTLAQVTLDLNQRNDTDALIGALISNYGTPVAIDFSEPIRFIMWRNSIDEINIVVTRHHHQVADTSLSYEKRSDPPNEPFDRRNPRTDRSF